LQTENAEFTPNVAEVAFIFSSLCVPSGQSMFSGLANGEYMLTVSKGGYQTFSDTIEILNSWQQKEIVLNPL
jgi:hypothetical protein